MNWANQKARTMKQERAWCGSNEKSSWHHFVANKFQAVFGDETSTHRRNRMKEWERKKQRERRRESKDVSKFESLPMLNVSHQAMQCQSMVYLFLLLLFFVFLLLFFISSTNTDNLAESNRNGENTDYFHEILKFLTATEWSERNEMQTKRPMKMKNAKKKYMGEEVEVKKKYGTKSILKWNAFILFDVWLRRHDCGYTETCIWYRCIEIETKVCNSFFLLIIVFTTHMNVYFYLCGKVKWNINGYQGRGESPLHDFQSN